MADLFELALAKKLSGGGGGDSDFSTARLTVAGTIVETTLYVPYLGDSPVGTVMWPSIGVAGTYEVVVHTNGTVMLAITSKTITIEGNVQQMGANVYLITGDCTITIS